MKGVGFSIHVYSLLRTQRLLSLKFQSRETLESELEGYEIHAGETQTQTAWLEITSRNGEQVSIMDGSISSDGKIWGCYIHGLFNNDSFRRAWLKSLGWTGEVVSQEERFEASLERLADEVEQALDMDLLEKIIWDS